MKAIVVVYLILINLITFIFMYVDKQRAIRHKWRIPEHTLMLLAVLGGSIGGLMGMNLFHHKTKHAKFKYGFPLILIIELSIAYYLLHNYF